MCGRFFLADSDNSGELRGIIDQLNRRGATVKTGAKRQERRRSFRTQCASTAA